MPRYNESMDINYSAQLQAVNDMRNAIYSFEFKTITNLQLINGGGAAVLIGFLSRLEIVQLSKWLFVGSIGSFIIGLIASLFLSIIYPSFMSLRYDSSFKEKELEKIKFRRKICMHVGIGCFIIAILLSLIAWIII